MSKLASEDIKIDILHMHLYCLVREICTKENLNFDGGYLGFFFNFNLLSVQKKLAH